MPQKIWKTEYNGMAIEFINKWNFTLDTDEKLLVNGEIVSRANTNIESGDRIVSGRHRAEVSDSESSYNIEVVVGSKWPGIFMGCHIFVNGELIGGDVNSKLMTKST